MRSMRTNGASKNRDYPAQNGVIDNIGRILRFIEVPWGSYGMYTYGIGLNWTSRPVPVVRVFSNVRIPDFQFFSLPVSESNHSFKNGEKP